MVEVRFWKADLTRFDEDWMRERTVKDNSCFTLFWFWQLGGAIAEEGVAR